MSISEKNKSKTHQTIQRLSQYTWLIRYSSQKDKIFADCHNAWLKYWKNNISQDLELRAKKIINRQVSMSILMSVEKDTCNSKLMALDRRIQEIEQTIGFIAWVGEITGKNQIWNCFIETCIDDTDIVVKEANEGITNIMKSDATEKWW